MESQQETKPQSVIRQCPIRPRNVENLIHPRERLILNFLQQKKIKELN